MEPFRNINENRSLQFLIGIGSVLLISSVCYLSIDFIGYHVVALILLLMVSILAIFFKVLPVVIVAVLSALIWNFLFIQPQLTFKINTPEDALLFLMYFVIAVMNAVFTTKIRKAEAQARKRREKEKTIQLYNTLFNSLSHELKTPIAAIIGSVDNLKENSEKLSKDNTIDLYNEIEIAGNRLNRQVKNLLNMSRLESGSIHIHPNWYDISEIIYNVIEHNKMVDNEHMIVYHSKDLPLLLFDGTLIEQILHNIIHNAIQYTPEGSTIEINAEATNEACVIQISDNGKGFPDENIEQVFEKFYRLPKSIAGGTGLGLSIAQGFARAHNGKIELRNKTEGGAEFTITIPAKMTDPKHYQNE